MVILHNFQIFTCTPCISVMLHESLIKFYFKQFSILHFTFLFSLFVFVSAAGHYFRIWTAHYFRIWTGHYFSIWTGQVPALLFQMKSIIQQIDHVTSGHMAVYEPVRHQKHIIWTMTLSTMNYLLYISIIFMDKS